jgi:thiol-disulfide isomerase/thioredoxin
MKRAAFLLYLLLPASLSAMPQMIQQWSGQPATPPTSPTPATGGILRWRNGESVTGDIASATSGDITWKTPLFEDPLQVRWDVIDQIDWAPQAMEPAGPFGIALRDGSFIYGDLTAITPDSISIHSARHGDAVLKRPEVLSLRRIKGGDLVYSGPQGDTGWEAMANQPGGNFSRNPLPDFTPPLATGPGGALLIRNWNRSAAMDLTLPASVEVEFRIHSSKRPEFMIKFGQISSDSLRIETWDNELVLAATNQFQPIRKIEDTEREIALRLCWDRQTQQCSIYDDAGKRIAEWHSPLPPFVPPAASSHTSTSKTPVFQISPTAPHATAITFRLVGGGNFNIGGMRRQGVRFPSNRSEGGLIVQNRGLDLSLDCLRVRSWDGKPPAKIDPQQPHVELANGQSLAGAITAGASGSITVQAPGQAAPANCKIADIDAVIFSTAPPQPSDHRATFIYSDGTMVLGTIDSIASGRAVISTSFSQAPLTSQLAGVQQLALPAPESKPPVPAPDLATEDKIVIEQTTLHGKLTADADGSLRWMPIGGVQASRPSMSLPSEMTRALPPHTPPPYEPALFYMDSGDVLPGSLQSMDKSGAEFASSIMDARKLPASKIDAIEFVLPVSADAKSFDDPSWKILKGDSKSIQRKGNTLQMEPATSIEIPLVMQSSEISFKMNGQGLSGVRLRMFCGDGATDKSTHLLLATTGNQFLAGGEAANGQFDNQSQTMIKQGEPVSVRLEISDDKVEVFANDVSLLEIPIDPANCSGTGLIIEPASVWGNNPFPVSLSDFSTKLDPGRTWLPEVSDEIRTQVLTVPRFEKDDPPKHLLLAANGDVLRGEVEAATDTHFGFRCGLEELNVPRDRVRAVIWLKPPDPAASTAPAGDTPPDVLKDCIQMRIMFGGAGLNQYMSFLQSQDSRLKYKLPDHDEQHIVQMQLGNQTVGEALNAICARFEMTYRVDTDGTIVLESQALETGNGLVRKDYWLKPGAILTSSPLQDMLTSKGINFPPDSSVKWDPRADLLSMINTPDNQARLAALINSDFGGSLGSPTYWLELISGGRIGLAMDRFQGDSIIGHTPAYGTVKVPMAEVYLIRTAPLEPTAALKTLANWRLVDAPDPVIPGTGGDASPLLGKDALPIKLPLLAGGDFDLAAQKGQVIVLDFWASWCGPCIKSLPGLIEMVAAFPSDKVKLIGINQGETADQIKKFMEVRGLKFTVALDADQGVGQKYGVDAIPHTIIVGPDGKVAWTQTGYDPDGDSEASDTVKHLLGLVPPGAAPAPKTQ